MEIKILKQWLKENKRAEGESVSVPVFRERSDKNYRNQHKLNLVEYLQGQICKYSNQDLTPAEQIKGMNRLLRDIIELRDREFE